MYMHTFNYYFYIDIHEPQLARIVNQVTFNEVYECTYIQYIRQTYICTSVFVGKYL